MDSATVRFGSFEIHRGEKLLRRAGEPVSLPPKAVDTLLRLIESPGQLVTKEELIAAIWPDVVVEENNLTQQISILRKTFAPESNGSGWIQTVPKRGYRFTAPIASQPQTAQAPALHRPRNGSFLFALGSIVVLVGLAILLASSAVQPEEIRTVAVLPIQPLVPSEELSAVGLGISDAVVQRLSYSPELSVRPMASMRRYLGGSVDPLAVGREANVDAVIAGTIQRDGDRYRVTVELIDVRSNRSRWNVKIEENAADTFRIQDMVAEATLRSMPEQTTSAAAIPPARRTPVAAAHEAFLKGRYYWSRRTSGDVERAVAELERAVSIDDSYAAAWGGLASALNLQSTHFVGEPGASFARARSAARQSVLLDPDLAEAHAALGFISFYYEWNWTEAEKSFRRAIELDATNGNYRQLLSNLLIATGRTEEAIRQIDEAVRSDPANIMARAVAGRQRYLAGDHAGAVEILRQTIAMDNTFSAPHVSLGHALLFLGNYDEARKEFEQGARLNRGPQQLAFLAYLSARRGDRGEAERYLAEAREASKNGAVPHYDYAAVHVAAGDFDTAFRHLETALRERYSGLVWLNVDARFDPVRSDPRFQSVVSRVGLKSG